MVDESIKFAWAYLLTHGEETTGEWSYYGSCWERPWKDSTPTPSIIKEVASVGIDWEASGVPEVTEQEGFAGTFVSYNDKCQATLGILVLKNGKTYKIGSSDTFTASLANTAKLMLDNKPSKVTKLMKLI